MASSDSDSSTYSNDSEDFLEQENLSDDEFLTHGDIHPLLQADIKRLVEAHSQSAVHYRILPHINEIDLNIFISTQVLERDIAAAWNFIYGEAITVCLSINPSLYLRDELWRVKVFQASSPTQTGAISQLQNIANAFCAASFGKLTNEEVASAVIESEVPNGKIEDVDVVHLMEMGFPSNAAKKALEISEGSREKAIDILLLDHMSLESSGPDGHHPDEALLLLKKSKEAPSLEKGFLVQLYQYLHQRLFTLNEHCPICDTNHNLPPPSMLKPTVCSNELCIFSFGLASSVTESINSHFKVSDLLLHLTRAAVFSPRSDKILSPYPEVFESSKPKTLAFSRQNKCTDLLRKTLCDIPPLTKLHGLSKDEMLQMLNQHGNLCYPLLRWILNSNRSYIQALPEAKRMKWMSTNHQFLVRNLPPTEEKRFLEYKRKHGSTFAFHGSPIENWHSIIREGLIVASGTGKQLHGASYGKGIYLSPSLQMSLNYCQTQPLDFKKNGKAQSSELSSMSMFGLSSPKNACVALCEVIQAKGLDKNGNVWVCKQSELVCVRFLFVYDKLNCVPLSSSVSTNTQDKETMSQIQHAIENNSTQSISDEHSLDTLNGTKGATASLYNGSC